MRTMEKILEDAQTVYSFLSDTEEENAPETAEIVLAMGGSDRTVADTAAQAFFEKQAQWLICAGGLGKDTAELLAEPEGVLYARRCVELGVPEDRILVESRSTNSGENFRFSRALLEERKIFPQTGIVASKPYMARRAWATAAMQWSQVRWGVACRKIGLVEYLRQAGDTALVLELMVGDLQRLRVYAGTYQQPVPVPGPVWAAYERLAADGYDRFVIRSKCSKLDKAADAVYTINERVHK